MLRVMTPEYASPEQVKGENITTASDVYSLGVLLYELLTGRRPYHFKSRRPEDVSRAVCDEAPERPSAALSRPEEPLAIGGASPKETSRAKRARKRPADTERRRLRGDLDNIILMALRKEPQRRYASVSDFSEDIRRHLDGLPVRARKDTFPYRASKFIRRNKIAVAAAVIVSLTLVGGIIATAWEARVARAERAQAEQRFNDVRQLAHSVLFDYHDAIANLPGSTPVRERLVRDAIEYLNRLSQQAGKDAALRRELARAYLKVGDVLGRPYRPNLGHTDAAMENYLKARSIFDELLKADPTDYASRRDLSVTYEDIGLIQARAYEWTQAVESQRQALTIREALTANDPNNQDFRSLLGDSYFNFADAMMFSAIRYGRKRANVNDRIALENYRKSLSIRETLSEREPTNRVIRRDLAQSYQRIGIAMLAICDSNTPLDGTPIPPEDFRQIIESHNKSLALRETLLASEPLSAQARRDLADEYVMRGDAQVRGGDFAGALKGYHQSLPILESLLAADPTNAEARSELAFAYLSISVPLEKLNDEAGALENYRRSLHIFEAMFRDDPSNEEIWKNLLSGYKKISVLLAVRGRAGEALSEARRALSLIESRPIPYSSSPETDTYMAHQYEYIGDNYSAIALHGKISSTKREEDLRVARMWYQKSLNIWLDMKSRGTLSSADAGEPNGVSREITKCDTALGE
jgi:non-specific serine/threonine protein kinase/serine/threonine-protein kinase